MIQTIELRYVLSNWVFIPKNKSMMCDSNRWLKFSNTYAPRVSKWFLKFHAYKFDFSDTTSSYLHIRWQKLYPYFANYFAYNLFVWGQQCCLHLIKIDIIKELVAYANPLNILRQSEHLSGILINALLITSVLSAWHYDFIGGIPSFIQNHFACSQEQDCLLRTKTSSRKQISP